jgi:hypothetical protein
MCLPLLSLLLLATPGSGTATERIAVLAVHDPPAPDGELTELAHQLRAASLERIGGVLTAPEMRDRLAGKSGGATVQELDRAFGGALAVYQNGEFESAARTLRAIIDDLEDLPESEAVWSQWTRAMMRLSHVHLSMKQLEELDAVQVALLKVDSTHQLDPVLYAPGFRAHFEELRQRVRAMPKRRLTVTARGRAGNIYVSGRDLGPTPATVILPAGTYRVAGAAGALRIPSFTVDLGGEDRAVVLDFALAETFRPGAGPGMVLPAGDRAAAIIRAGAWLGVEKLVVASRGSEGGAQFLVGAIYDVRRGALLREGSVRMLSGSVPPANLGALAAFLLTGQSSREVLDRSRDPQAARHAPPRATTPAAAPAPPAPPPAPQVTFIPAAPPPARGAPTVVVAAVSAVAPRAPSAPSSPETAPAPPPAAPGSSPAGAPPAKVAAAEGAPRAGTRGPPSTPSHELRADPAPPAVRPPAVAAPQPAPAPPAAADAAPDLRPTPPAEDPVAHALAAPPLGATPPPARWLRPTALGAGLLAAALAGLAAQQGLAARGAYGDADAMVLPGGIIRVPYTRADHTSAIGRGDAASRNAWLAGSGAALSGAAGAVLYWLSRGDAPTR